MNWFKRIIKLCQQTIIEKPKTYLDIGHTLENSNNYIWVFDKGEIISIRQDEEKLRHADAFPGFDFGANWTGRYEGDTGRLSIVGPSRGISKYRSVPPSVMEKLKYEFPNITKIFKF